MSTPKTFLLGLTCVSVLMQVRSDLNYGPFVAHITNLTACKGPKNQDCGSIDMRMYNNGSILHSKLELLKDCPIMQIKTQVFSNQASAVNNIFNYNTHKPCGHFFFGPQLRNWYNVTKKCVIKKGTYILDLELDQVMRKFFGNEFFYGTYNIKSMAFNQVDNVFCTMTVLSFESLA